ncbi:MAG: hypothetical protein HFJ79_06680 [Clostridiales bacterium]|nr:hypothetical protein [Clostridiales bacterium]
MQDSIDIKSILLVFLKGIKVLIAATVIGCLLMFIVSKFVMTPLYTSSVSMYVSSNSDNVNTNLNVNDITASQKLIDTYIVILQQREVMKQVAEEVALTMPCTLKQVQEAITMSAKSNTWVLQIDAVTDDPDLSAAICNAMAKVAPEVLTEVVGSGSATSIGTAVPSVSPSSPHVVTNSIIGALAGLVLAALYLLIRYMTDTTVKSEEDLKNRYDVPILGEIPDFYQQKKGGYSYGK